MWQLWSPNWAFDDATFSATAASFDNPDFVAVTVQSYRHRYGNAPGDPAYDALEKQLEAQPVIDVPSVVLHGECDGVGPAVHSANAARNFGKRYARRVVPVAGHFLPREAPHEVVQALLSLASETDR